MPRNQASFRGIQPQLIDTITLIKCLERLGLVNRLPLRSRRDREALLRKLLRALFSILICPAPDPEWISSLTIGIRRDVIDLRRARLAHQNNISAYS